MPSGSQRVGPPGAVRAFLRRTRRAWGFPPRPAPVERQGRDRATMAGYRLGTHPAAGGRPGSQAAGPVGGGTDPPETLIGGHARNRAGRTPGRRRPKPFGWAGDGKDHKRMSVFKPTKNLASNPGRSVCHSHEAHPGLRLMRLAKHVAEDASVLAQCIVSAGLADAAAVEH